MRTVLIADDEPALLESIAEIVGDWGFEVVMARDGIEAFELGQSRRPDIVLSDYMMPGMSGVELIRAMKQHPRLQTVPVILLSAGQPRDAKEAWRFIPKPIDLDLLERSITEGLALQSEEPAEIEKVPEKPEPRSPLSLAREEMLNWVAHEIQSPLSAATLNANLIRNGLESGEKVGVLRRRSEAIIRQLGRMNELVSSILDAARLEEGRLGLIPKRVDLTKLLGESITLWNETYPEAQINLEAEPREVIVVVDEDRIRQILDNLVSNAVKYGQPSNEVKVFLEVVPGAVAIRVRDFGRGIPENQLSTIFDRFHRIGTGGRGHGLGLYIASALARLHRGALTVTSEIGKGSVFSLTLPLGNGNGTNGTAH